MNALWLFLAASDLSFPRLGVEALPKGAYSPPAYELASMCKCYPSVS